MRMNLTQRYLVFVAGVIVIILAISYAVTSSVMRDGLSDLFRERLERSPAVVEQYARADLLNRRKEIETIVSSPRFLAAIATGDSATVAREAPGYLSLSDADLLLVCASDGGILYASETVGASLVNDISAVLLRDNEYHKPKYFQANGELFQVLGTPVVTADGFRLGYLALGHTIQSYMPSELSQLSGFDVVITYQGRVAGHTLTPLVRRFLSDSSQQVVPSMTVDQTDRIELHGEQILYHAVSFESLVITFLAPVEEHIMPIMSDISTLLTTVAVSVGLLSMLVIYLFTQRRIGRQVNLLVDAAKRIGADDLDFEIKPTSRDELGYLAGEFERTRSRILESREALKGAHEDRVRAERLAAIGRLTAGIVHDIKNPMAVIGGNAELIRRTHSNDDRLQARCDEIINQIERVKELTAELLEYSRGKTKLELQTVDIANYMAGVASHHEPNFLSAGISLRLSGPADICAHIDPHRFQRVVDNLCNNAREALKPGRCVEISWEVTDTVRLRVADNGPGIPAPILETIFEPFVTHGKESGTGLGLAITRQIVEDHGGAIEVSSTPGEGSCFTISLPLVDSPTNQPPTGAVTEGAIT